MPRGRESEGEAPLSNAARQARYRARHKEKQPSVVVRSRRPVDRRSRLQHWHDAVAELVDLQAGYATWLDALPESLRGTATAEALRRSPIWTSTSWPQSSRRAATGATDTWSGRTHG